MGRRGQFVRLGTVRTSDHEGLADLARRAAGTDLTPAAAQELHDAVTEFLGRHGSHEFMLRLVDGGIDLTVGGDGPAGDRRIVHLELDLESAEGTFDLAHQASATALQEGPLGRKMHHAVEADHESTSGGGRSVGSDRSLGVSGDVTTAFGGVPPGVPNRVFSAKVGLGISAGSSRSHSFGEAAVSATKRLFEISGEVTHFDIPGAALAALVHRPGEARPAGRGTTPVSVRVAFPKEMAPPKADGDPGGAIMPDSHAIQRPPVGITDLGALAAEAPGGPLHRAAGRVAAAQHHFFNQAESVSGLRALRDAVRTELGDRGADPGFSEGVAFYLGEGSVMRMFGDITGPGSTSPMFVGADGRSGLHMTVTGQLRNAVPVTAAEVGLKEESQRFVNFSEGSSEGGSASLTLPAVNFGHTFGDLSAPMGGNSGLSISGSASGRISSSRGTDANSGSGHISGLVYNGESVLYRTTFHMNVDIATNAGGNAPRPVGRDVTVYLRVPVHEAPRFEAMLADQASATPHGHGAYADDPDHRPPPDPATDPEGAANEARESGMQRNPPLSMAAGRGTGFSAISHLAGSERVMPELVRLVQQSDAPKAWARPWDAMETAYLRTQLASRYTREGLINWGNALFQDGGVRMEIVRPAKEGVEVITVKVRARMEAPDGNAASPAAPIGQGRNSSAKLEIMPSAFAGNGGSDTVGSGLSVSGQVAGSGGIHTDEPTRVVGGNLTYGFSRDTADRLNVGASGFMLEAILYNGPVRTFDYRVAYDLEVTTRHQTGLNGLDWTALAPKAVTNLIAKRPAGVGATDRALEHTIDDGRARFVIAEKLAPENPIPKADVARAGVPQRIALPPPPVPAPRPRTGPGTAFRRTPGPAPERVVRLPDVQPHLVGGHTPLHADDQVTDVLGGDHLAREVVGLLQQLDVPPETYRDTPWMLTSSETLASSQVRGPSEIRQTLVVGGALSDKRVDVILTGFPHHVNAGTERIPIFQMHVAEGNGSVGASKSRSVSHSVKGTFSLGIMDHTDASADKTSGPSWSFSKNLGDKSSSSSRSLTPTAGRLTQGTRDYIENTGDMLWRITVVKRSDNMFHTGKPQAAHAAGQRPRRHQLPASGRRRARPPPPRRRQPGLPQTRASGHRAAAPRPGHRRRRQPAAHPPRGPRPRHPHDRPGARDAGQCQNPAEGAPAARPGRVRTADARPARARRRRGEARARRHRRGQPGARRRPAPPPAARPRHARRLLDRAGGARRRRHRGHRPEPGPGQARQRQTRQPAEPRVAGGARRPDAGPRPHPHRDPVAAAGQRACADPAARDPRPEQPGIRLPGAHRQRQRLPLHLPPQHRERVGDQTVFALGLDGRRTAGQGRPGRRGPVLQRLGRTRGLRLDLHGPRPLAVPDRRRPRHVLHRRAGRPVRRGVQRQRGGDPDRRALPLRRRRGHGPAPQDRRPGPGRGRPRPGTALDRRPPDRAGHGPQRPAQGRRPPGPRRAGSPRSGRSRPAPPRPTSG